METTNRDRIFERAAEVGRLVSQTAEFRYLKAAHEKISADKDATGQINEMRKLQTEIMGFLEKAEEPPEDLRHQLEALSESMQTSTRYQALISAQANFDKLMGKVQESIGSGIRTGEESRIVIA
ncbi:MAG: YlbF family regulator [Gemmatimonadales bacterium]|nr:MAG: YlbF family regulator [Gemmatimonadales bacterium]